MTQELTKPSEGRKTNNLVELLTGSNVNCDGVVSFKLDNKAHNAIGQLINSYEKQKGSVDNFNSKYPDKQIVVKEKEQ